ncbi:uncharacterized protein LOC112043831 isoform X2 [Bicyclus anynana]|uniref:Uncharacterized protein LOC112043831 isoform X2 n=1 Tax=Bicyclus anynana TaxID=110368 RepID=A0ABM3LZH4_BICAN|nr:uncharacterized protein LOC112043831 isoform X2 [Bicyclus anynana]
MDSGSNTSGRQSRLLRRLLGKLRGEHRYSTLDKRFSFSSTGMSESIGCGSANEEEDCEAPRPGVSTVTIDDAQFAANIDLSELERRLEREAREVAALASEARNAREAASRARLQRRALRAQKAQLLAHLAKLRDSEVRELESSVRVSDRKLFKSWEALRDSTDPAAFEPLLEEIRNKQTALECLLRLIESRRASVSAPALPPLPALSNDDDSSVQLGCVRKRQDNRRSNKRKRKEASREPRSVPLSGETSRDTPHQVTLVVQGGSAGVVSAPPARAQRASVRDILFFTTD